MPSRPKVNVVSTFPTRSSPTPGPPKTTTNGYSGSSRHLRKVLFLPLGPCSQTPYTLWIRKPPPKDSLELRVISYQSGHFVGRRMMSVQYFTKVIEGPEKTRLSDVVRDNLPSSRVNTRSKQKRWTKHRSVLTPNNPTPGLLRGCRSD